MAWPGEAYFPFDWYNTKTRHDIVESTSRMDLNRNTKILYLIGQKYPDTPYIDNPEY